MNHTNNILKTGFIVLALCIWTSATTFASGYYNNGNSNSNSNTNSNYEPPREHWWWSWWWWQNHGGNNNNHDDDDDDGNNNNSNYNNNNSHDDDDDGNNNNSNYNNNNSHDDDDDGNNNNSNYNNNNSHDDDDDGNWNNNNSHDDDDDDGNANYNNNNSHDDDDDGCTGEVTGLWVVKKGSGSSVGALYEGARLNDDCDVNIKALVSCEEEIGSVEFILNGSTHRIENNAPYALAGNSGAYFNDMNLAAGHYHLKVVVWSDHNGAGTQTDWLEINFEVVDVVGNRNSDCFLQSNGGNNNNNNHDDDDDDGNWNNNNNHDDDDDDGNWNNNNNHDDDDDDGNWNNNNSHDDDDDDGNWNNNNSHDDDDDDGNSNSNNNNNNNNGCYGEVVSLTLVRGGTSSDIGTLHDWYEIDRECGVNIRANVACDHQIGSVVFILNGNILQVENSAPYTMGGDLSGVYKSLPDSELPLGNNHLEVVPYTSTNGNGSAGTSYHLWFTVVDEDCGHDDDDDGNWNNNNNHDDDDDDGNWNNNNSHDDDDDDGNWNNNNNHDDDDDGNWNNNNSNYKMSSSNEDEGDVVRIFPNPTAGEFEIRLALAESGDINVRLFDVSGKVIVEDNKLGFTGVYNKKVDLRKHSTGIYFLSLNVNGKITTQKILYNR